MSVRARRAPHRRPASPRGARLGGLELLAALLLGAAACGPPAPRVQAPRPPPPPPLPILTGVPLDGPHASCFPGFVEFDVARPSNASHAGSDVCRDFGDPASPPSLGPLLFARFTYVSYGHADSDPSGCFLSVRTQAGWFLEDLHCEGGFTSSAQTSPERIEAVPLGVGGAARLVFASHWHASQRDGGQTAMDELTICGVGPSGIPSCVSAVTRYFDHASEEYYDEEEDEAEPPPDVRWSTHVELREADELMVRGPPPRDDIPDHARRAKQFLEPGAYRLVFR